MKEASGEANMTVVTIILISVVVAVVTPIITSMMKTTQKRSCCMEAGGTWSNGSCSDINTEDENYQECISGSASTSGSTTTGQ